MFMAVVRYWILLEMGLTVTMHKWVPWQALGHGTIVFPQAPTDDEAQMLIEAFGGPIPNLTGEPKKR